jgi:hypothetical protein
MTSELRTTRKAASKKRQKTKSHNSFAIPQLKDALGWKQILLLSQRPDRIALQNRTAQGCASAPCVMLVRTVRKARFSQHFVMMMPRLAAGVVRELHVFCTDGGACQACVTLCTKTEKDVETTNRLFCSNKTLSTELFRYQWRTIFSFQHRLFWGS